jgi:two-component system, sensor histidine kinase PdtaS
LLRVCDNGVGLPLGFDFKKTAGLGTRIVTALAQTLDADLKAKPRDPGAEFEVQIPLKSLSPPHLQ